MAAQHFLAHLRRRFAHFLQQIDDRMAVGIVQPISVLVAGHRHLLDVLAELDARQTVDLRHFVHAAEGRLPLTRHYKDTHHREHNMIALLDRRDMKKETRTAQNTYPNACRCQSNRCCGPARSG